MNKFEKLLEEKNYLELLDLIQKELSQPFNLTSYDEIDRYNSLNELKEATYGQILYSANSSKEFIEDNLQSGEVWVKVPEENRYKYFRALSQIKLVTSKQKYHYVSEAQILIAEVNDILQDKSKRLTDIKKLSKKEYAQGNFFHNEADDEDNTENEYYSIIYNDEDKEKLEHILIAIRKVIKAIYSRELGWGQVRIKLLINSLKVSEEFCKTYLYTLLLQLLLGIYTNNTTYKKPIFVFEFEDIKVKDTFEKIIVGLNKPEEKINSITKTQEERLESFSKEVWTNDEKYRKVLRSLLSIIDEDYSILLIGESGVGKSWLAKIIHEESNRSKYKFEEVNCGELSKEEIDSKFYGWKRGAFTGNVGDHKGYLRRVDNGTFFFDEIDRATKEVRDSLITVIENKVAKVLGGDPEKVDVRFIYGTNKDLIEMVEQGTFEEDFYNRICHRVIRIPALRERPEDIEIITQNILNDMNIKKGRNISIDKEAVEYLKKHLWPGNFRELDRYISINVYSECLKRNINNITSELLQSIPFSDSPKVRKNDFNSLENLFKKYLDSWDYEEENFLDGFIKPVLAKVYIVDYSTGTNKTQMNSKSAAIIGMDGSRGNNSTLIKAYHKYNEVKNKF